MDLQPDFNVYRRMTEITPLVPMTLRIGVAGHRQLPKEGTPEMQSLCNQIQAIYANIDRIVQQIAADDTAAALYDKTVTPIIRIISSLAEGADRLWIEPELIPFEPELACIIPFTKEEFEKDFLPGASICDTQNGTVAKFDELLERIGYGQPTLQMIELDGDPNNRDEAYRQCSKLLAQHSDILLAVYDGDDTKDSGTAATVKAAREMGVPVVHVSTNPQQPLRIIPGRQINGSLALLNFQDELLHELRRILLFSDTLDGLEIDIKQTLQERFLNYQADKKLCHIIDENPDYGNAGPIALKKEYKNLCARAFDALTKWVANATNVADKQRELQLKIDSSIELPGVFADRSRDRYYSAFLFADRLANYFSRIHRSTFVLIYLLGAVALIAASLALALKSFHLVKFTFVLVLLELGLLVIIYKLYYGDRHQQKYHKRWLEYRHLAETLRPMLYLALLGKSYSVSLNLSPKAERIWQALYAATVHRWAGFGHCTLQQQKSMMQIWLKGQIQYHSKNASVMSVLGVKLESWNHSLFVVTLVFVCAKLASIGIEWLITPDNALQEWLGMLSFPLALGVIVLPILATTSFAIRHHAEFDISAQRSLTMHTMLVSIYSNLYQEKISSDQLTSEMYRIIAVAMQENNEWLDIFKVKQSEI